MDSTKEGKVLPIRKRIDERADHDAEPLSWEQEYFARISESTKVHTSNPDVYGRSVVAIPITRISLSPFQTREILHDDELLELKNSILSRGVIQPILVRRSSEEGMFELVAGERRFRATILAGFETVPALIEDLSDQESLELSIIENAQRENLNPIEEARAYQLLSEQFQLSHAEIARIVGKNRVTVSNSLRLLQLATEVIELLRNGELTAGHGRALLFLDEPSAQLDLARLAVKKALSVRALEQMVSMGVDESPRNTDSDEQETRSLRRVEEKISGFLGIEKVRLSTDTHGARKLTMSFETEASWKRFMAKIKD